MSDFYINTYTTEYDNIIDKYFEENNGLLNTDKKMHTLLFYLNNLPKTRIVDIKSFINIGKVHYNIYKDNPIGLNTWIEYGKLFNINISNCSKFYDSFSNENPITIKTIAYYLKLDNPVLYKKWFDKNIKYYISTCFNCNEDNIASLIYNFFWLDYFYCANTNTWYYYDVFILKQDNKNLHLKKNILLHFHPILTSFKEYILEYTRNIVIKKNIQLQAIISLIKKISTDSFLTSCINNSKKFFIIENFNSYLDNNKNITVLENIVLEVIPILRIILERPSIPEDYIITNFDLQYNKNMKYNNSAMILFTEWLQQLFPDKTERDYVIKLFTSIVFEKTILNRNIIFVGNDDSGKLHFCYLLEKIFKCYTKLVVNCKKNNTYKNVYNYKFFNTCKLINCENKTHIGIINSNECNNILCFNVLPNFNELVDNSIVINFTSTYLVNLNNFETEILPKLIEPFLWLLVQTYPKFVEEGIGEILPTKNYKDIDIYLNFKEDYIKESDPADTLIETSLYQIFKKWHVINYPSQLENIPDKSLFTKEMSRSELLGIRVAKKWIGFRINVK